MPADGSPANEAQALAFLTDQRQNEGQEMRRGRFDSIIERTFSEALPTFPPNSKGRNPEHGIEDGRKRGRYDSMIERAFASPKTADSSPQMSVKDLNRPSAPASEAGSDVSPPEMPASPAGGTLEPIWEEVRQAKEKRLAVLPSKVKSLEVMQEAVEHHGVPKEVDATKSGDTTPKPQNTSKNGKLNSGVTFKESADALQVTATIEMHGVKKEDMHVSFRGNRIVVTWRKHRTIEKKEGDVLVRERFEKQYSQVIPLPEGTKFEQVKAGRNGRQLILTYPNIRASRMLTNSSATAVSQYGAPTEFFTCLEE